MECVVTKKMFKKLLGIAISFRLGILLWGTLVDYLIPNYDTSFEAYTFAKWDSIFFVRIAKTGFYEYEHFHAFFPGYPFLICCLALLIRL